MKRTVIYNEKTINYELQYKKVKNINLRIKPDGSINVSANRWVSQKVIDDFIISKGDFIVNALKKYSEKANMISKPYFTEEEVKDLVINICKKVYPYYKEKDIDFPEIKFRKMRSRWGSCHSVKKVLTFNTYLMCAPIECVEYVVWHEFTHFLQANHSVKFYEELSKVCPDWKKCREKLREINIV